MDDRLLALSGDAQSASSLDDTVTLGADTVHSLVSWGRVAPKPTSTKKPSGFNGVSPAAYPAANWDPWDTMVRGANDRDLDVILVPVLRGPYWASQCKGSQKKIAACKPSPTEFGKFVQALGKRYSGSYRDENQGGGVLPRVSRWSISNEPGIAGWLYPQFKLVKGQAIAQSPIHYRKVVYKAAAALKKTGHSTKTDQILLFEGQPVGRNTSTLAKRTMAPKVFLLELFCLDPKGKPYTGAAAKLRECNGKYKKLPVDGLAHHPYTRAAAKPPYTGAKANDITYSSLTKLNKLLKLGSKYGRIPANLDIYLTEYGIQSKPPETNFGQSLENQARYLNQADYIAYKNPRIKSVCQYQLADEPPDGSFQTGLRFNDLSKKPAWDAYRLPIYVVQAGSSPKVYGQLRPAPAGSTQQVEIQRKQTERDSFVTVQTVTVSNRRNNFFVRVSQSDGIWRLAWTPSAGGDTIYSREAEEESR